MEISVSYLSSKYDIKKTIDLIEMTNADYIHVDLMDGGFVPAKNFNLLEVVTLLKSVKKKLDIHLMVFDPIIYIDDLAKLKPQYITFHIEATKDIVKTIEKIKEKNINVGLAIKPDTNIYELIPYLSFVDLVLIMSVNPGWGGQNFMPEAISHFKELLKIREDNHLSFKIEMDGGINKETIQLVPKLDIAVSGSFVCTSDNYQARIDELKQNH